MSKIYIIRAILDADDDVIRDVAISGSSTLFDLHLLMVEAFDLDKGEMSSFFKSNDEWDQGEEISMMDFDPATGKNPLDKMLVEEAFADKGNRMLFAYDYMNLWTFYLEATEIKAAEEGKSYPAVIGAVGTRPQQAPQKEMRADSLDDDLYNLDDDMNNHHNEEDDENDLWL